MTVLLGLGRVRRWFGMFGGGSDDRAVPVGVKQASAETLIELMSVSRRDGIGATGRPAWVAESLSTIELVLIVPQGRAGLDVLRCNCAIYQRGEFRWIFSLDMTLASYDRLPDVGRRQCIRFLRDLLLRIPVLPLDEDQEASWESTSDGGQPG